VGDAGDSESVVGRDDLAKARGAVVRLGVGGGQEDDRLAGLADDLRLVERRATGAVGIGRRGEDEVLVVHEGAELDHRDIDGSAVHDRIGAALVLVGELLREIPKARQIEPAAAVSGLQELEAGRAGRRDRPDRTEHRLDRGVGLAATSPLGGDGLAEDRLLLHLGHLDRVVGRVRLGPGAAAVDIVLEGQRDAEGVPLGGAAGRIEQADRVAAVGLIAAAEGVGLEAAAGDHRQERRECRIRAAVLVVAEAGVVAIGEVGIVAVVDGAEAVEVGDRRAVAVPTLGRIGIGTRRQDVADEVAAVDVGAAVDRIVATGIGVAPGRLQGVSVPDVAGQGDGGALVVAGEILRVQVRAQRRVPNRDHHAVAVGVGAVAQHLVGGIATLLHRLDLAIDDDPVDDVEFVERLSDVHQFTAGRIDVDDAREIRLRPAAVGFGTRGQRRQLLGRPIDPPLHGGTGLDHDLLDGGDVRPVHADGKWHRVGGSLNPEVVAELHHNPSGRHALAGSRVDRFDERLRRELAALQLATWAVDGLAGPLEHLGVDHRVRLVEDRLDPRHRSADRRWSRR
jgi:hypothetical protein